MNKFKHNLSVSLSYIAPIILKCSITFVCLFLVISLTMDNVLNSNGLSIAIILNQCLTILSLGFVGMVLGLVFVAKIKVIEWIKILTKMY